MAKAAGAMSEDLLVEILRQAKLRADIFRRGEGRRQRRLGLAPPRDIGVIDQRHDGMEIRRGCQFDLAALGCGTIFAQDEAEDLVVHIEDGVLFRLRKVAALFLEFRQEGKTSHRREAAPLQVIKSLKIAEIGLGKGADNGVELGEGVIRTALGEQFGVARHGTDQGVPIDLEKILEDVAAILVVEAGRRFAADGFPFVLDLALDEFQDLPDQDGGEVEIDPHLGLRGDEVDHVEITLGGMEPHPGHLCLFRQRIDVVRLVHVPEDDDVHARASPRRNRAASSG